MTHVNENNNYNFINNDDLQIINVESEEQWNIDFIIDRSPDFNLINNLENIINQHFDEIFSQDVEAIINNADQFNTDENIDNMLELDTANDFIPFQLVITQSFVESEVNQLQVTEEERECIICYETREYHDIAQINCGHKFCGNCLIEFIRVNRIEPHCPLCRNDIIHISFQTHQHNDTFLEI